MAVAYCFIITVLRIQLFGGSLSLLGTYPFQIPRPLRSGHLQTNCTLLYKGLVCIERLSNALERDIVACLAYDLEQVYYRQFGGLWGTNIFSGS